MKKADVKESVVGFFDVLGFGNRVKAAKTFTDLLAIESDLRTIQAEFGVTPRDRLDKYNNQVTGRKVLSFSDNIVYSVPLISPFTARSGTFDGLMMILDQIACAQGALVLNGVFLRGGVDIGLWFKSKDVMISSALVNAVGLEKTVFYPVVAVSPETHTHFLSHIDRRRYASGTDGVDWFFRELTHQEKGQEQTFAFLDYVAICLADVEEDYPDAWLWLERHKRSIGAARSKVTTEDAIRKYEWLMDYHDEHVRRYINISHHGEKFHSLLFRNG